MELVAVAFTAILAFAAGYGVRAYATRTRRREGIWR